MAVRVTERRLDSKRRVTIPNTVNFKAGSKVVVVASPDSAIIAPNIKIAESIFELLQEVESKKKQKALDEWEALLTKAHLSGVTSKEIDQAVAREIKRRVGHIHVSEAANNH
jgi:virulence-associated protein VagC